MRMKVHHTPAVCEHECKYGECVMPNKCKCFPGFVGKTCSQDINECGLKPHPCEHRCMNTHGSYKCFCLNGYMLMPDGTCANSRTCAMVNCQYGCEEVKDDVRCLCPSSGLQLAPNGKTCIDIDECSTGKAICSFNRRCVNTFGSYYCKCQVGYEMKYVNGQYDCVDINECAANTQTCDLHAECLNTQGSFKCKCKLGYRGNGFECSVLHENSVKEIPKTSEATKEKFKKLFVHKHSVKKHEDIKNVIPEPPVTPPSNAHVGPLDYEDGIDIEDPDYDSKQGKGNEDAERGDRLEEKGEVEEEREDHENQSEPEKKLRGDVFSKEAAAFGPLPIQRKIPLEKSELEVDCSFDQGTCAWQQDANDDFDWNPADHDNGDGYYMAVPAFMGHKKDVGRLKLLLTELKPKGIYCLIFSYRLAGDRVGKLRVIVGNDSHNAAWEQSLADDGRWKTGQMEVFVVTSSTNITFEAERGKGKTGEIGVDTVILVSGLCPEDHLTLAI
ncbi:epidermal growth factor-like protein 6 isoform X2 [Paroedura picta]|uniref:epidermal growth factor-like protein 6 isoform X2 n=1 Tax=Paroedura picta TaxID=143630 RepID=UPI0040562AD1